MIWMQLPHSFIVKDDECTYCQRKEGDKTKGDVGFEVERAYIFARHKVLSRVTLLKVMSLHICTEVQLVNHFGVAVF